ncbi:hypothetical protein NH340_JMT05645 [Sarcoptes scabiei]|nr:hypothetical protein NH340_JMT05645 [Sarcoptes scabiei]
MSKEKDLLLMNKLEYLKEIRYRMQEIDRMRSSINEELDLINVEEKFLLEYRREMDSLYQEKMTHVEELRQIHSDMNMLENVMKQSEEDRNRRVDNVKRLHNTLQQMKEEMEKMRSEIGLPKSNENKKDDSIMIDKLDFDSKKSSFHHKADCYEMKSNIDINKQLSSSNNIVENQAINKPFADNTNTAVSSASPAFPSLASLMTGFHEKHHQSSNLNRLSLMSNPSNSLTANSNFTQESQISSPAAAFRQQPPPMKSCLSCHQQIHRNAPICPLCKAKSRSRHPKRRNNVKN